MHNCVKTPKVLSALKKLGFKEIRQKGSHLFLEHQDGRTTVLPMHPEIHIHLLTKIIKHDLKMGKEEFFRLL